MAEAEVVKPKVIVFGGCGFLGREIVYYLVSENIASSVYVVDKVPPQMAWLNSKHQAIFKHPMVSYKSANLINISSVENVFQGKFDWAINAAGETKPALDELVYKEGITTLSMNVAKVCADRKVKVYIEVSDGRLTSEVAAEAASSKATSTIKSASIMANCKAQVESQLPGIKSLPWIIVRPGLIYGPGDKQGLVRNLVMGAVYRKLGEKLKLLWDAGLKLNTVHVTDCARAVVYLCQQQKVHQTYNIVDEADSTQGTLGAIIANIFNIKLDFYGTAASHIVKLHPEGTVAEANEKHLPPWAELCSEVSNTPLTPYIDGDIIKGIPIQLNGEKIKKLGFVYNVPKPTKENVLEILEELVELKLFPRAAIPEGVLKPLPKPQTKAEIKPKENSEPKSEAAPEPKSEEIPVGKPTVKE